MSRDDLRTALFGADYHKSTPDFASEELVTAAEHAAIKAALKAGKDVISDNTNLRPKFAQKIADIGYALAAEVEVKVFDDLSLKECLQNNKVRGVHGGRFVPEDVIRKQHSQLQGSKDWTPVEFKPIPYHGTPGKPKAILVDVDGTLAHMNDKRGPFDWAKVGQDDPEVNLMDLLAWVRLGMDVEHDIKPWTGPPEIIIMSGRDAVCRNETESWLKYWGVVYDNLFMRPEGDMRKDSIVKAELFDKHVRDNYDVVMVFDDRNQVVDMWRQMGLTVAQVAEGDF